MIWVYLEGRANAGEMTWARGVHLGRTGMGSGLARAVESTQVAVELVFGRAEAWLASLQSHCSRSAAHCEHHWMRSEEICDFVRHFDVSYSVV